MRLTIKRKQIVILALLLVLLSIVLIQGCGDNSTQCTAPDGSTITINPNAQTISGGGIVVPVTLDWTVRVALPDGSVMPNTCITVSGAFAVPNGYALYQFQYYPSSVSPNLPVNSGFSAQTNDAGEYTFSTLLSANTGTWEDTIYVRSGTNVGTADLTLTD